MIAAGEIYIADFPEAGPHPVIVVSRGHVIESDCEPV